MHQTISGLSTTDSEEGQSLAFITFALVALLSMTALIIDGGYAYAQRRRMQNAADLAALAGARAVGMGLSAYEIQQAISYYAQANGADTFSFYYIDQNGQRVETLTSARGVHADTRRTFNTFLAAIVGINQMTAAAESEASLYGIGGTGNLLPIIMYDNGFALEYGQEYDLWDDQHEAPGAFGWVDWDGRGGASDLREDIRNPANSGYRRIGEEVGAQTGVAASVCEEVGRWLNLSVTIPFYSRISGQGNNTRYTISGFGEFVLTDYQCRGNPKSISGYFVRWVTPGEPGGPAFGLQGVRLTK